MNLKIYHNPRCRKSREALQYLEETKKFWHHQLSWQAFTVQYIEQLLKELSYRPEELIRKSEAIWKEEYKGKDLSADELVAALSENPKLIERPIISNGKSAVIAAHSKNWSIFKIIYLTETFGLNCSICNKILMKRKPRLSIFIDRPFCYCATSQNFQNH